MISTLSGRVISIGLDQLVLDVGGMGFAVRTTPQSLADARHGQELVMHTELVVREDSLTLFGFPTQEEADVFRTVQSVTGIGPRIALAMMAVMSPDDLRRAVAAGDLKTITRAPGVGPKVAQRVVLELKDKLGPAPAVPAGPSSEAGATDADPADAEDAVSADVIEALIGLGWPEKAARKAVDAAPDDARTESGALLRAALRGLGGTR